MLCHPPPRRPCFLLPPLRRPPLRRHTTTHGTASDNAAANTTLPPRDRLLPRRCPQLCRPRHRLRPLRLPPLRRSPLHLTRRCLPPRRPQQCTTVTTPPPGLRLRRRHLRPRRGGRSSPRLCLRLRRRPPRCLLQHRCNSISATATQTLASAACQLDLFLLQTLAATFLQPQPTQRK